jgi:hypothetical protein
VEFTRGTGSYCRRDPGGLGGSVVRVYVAGESRDFSRESGRDNESSQYSGCQSLRAAYLFSSMNNSGKPLRSRCYDVLDLIIVDTDYSGAEREAALTMRNHGIGSVYQERLLADTCEACGMSASCPYASVCEIGDTDPPQAATAGHRHSQPAGIDSGRVHIRRRR